jgi:hypothetical protein
VLNEKQRLFFRALKDIKDINVELSVGSLETNATRQSTEHLKKEYMLLEKKLNSLEDRKAFRKIQNDMIETVITEIMELIDGYGTLKYEVDLIDKETKQSLREKIELHDGFMNYIYENEG